VDVALELSFVFPEDEKVLSGSEPTGLVNTHLFVEQRPVDLKAIQCIASTKHQVLVGACHHEPSLVLNTVILSKKAF